jgi:hypothetical protein
MVNREFSLDRMWRGVINVPPLGRRPIIQYTDFHDKRKWGSQTIFLSYNGKYEHINGMADGAAGS